MLTQYILACNIGGLHGGVHMKGRGHAMNELAISVCFKNSYLVVVLVHVWVCTLRLIPCLFSS